MEASEIIEILNDINQEINYNLENITKSIVDGKTAPIEMTLLIGKLLSYNEIQRKLNNLLADNI